jgi:hypothetical protein
LKKSGWSQQSSVEPQFNNIPDYGVLGEFDRASEEITTDPSTIPLWQPIAAKYSSAFLDKCAKVITSSNEFSIELVIK